VQRVFTRAVTEASDAPPRETGAALGRLLYLAHLGVLLWWLSDRSPGQSATTALVERLEHLLPAAGFLLVLPTAGAQIAAFDALLRQALLGDTA
jgi:hypothetical protein